MLIRPIKRLLYSLNLIEPLCGKLITEEGGRGNMSDNDDFKITLRWKGKVRKRILKRTNPNNSYTRIVEFTPLSQKAIVSVRYTDACGGQANSTKIFRLSRESKIVVKYLNGEQTVIN